MPDILTEHEAAEYLRVTVAEVVVLLEAGEIRARHIGAGWRIHRQALDAWLTGEQPHPPVARSQSEPGRAPEHATPHSPTPSLQRPNSDVQPSAPRHWTPPHLAERIRAEQAAMEARGSNDGERKTITALFADLKGSTALIEGLDPEEARAIIDPALQIMMETVHRYEGYVAQALGVADPSSPLQQMLEDPQVRRRRTFAALKRLLLRASFNQPLLLVNYRPEYQHPWSNKTYYTQLRLDPLGKAEAEELLTALLGEGAELTLLKRLILDKTEGTPFFMEEVVQTLAEIYNWFTEGFDTRDLQEAKALLEQLS